MTKFLWSFSGGGDTVGLTVDNNGRALVMRKPASLIRLLSADGASVNFANGSTEKSNKDTFSEINGMTWLGDRCYVADTKAGKLVTLTGEDLTVADSVAVPGIMQPAADVKTGLIWAISDDELIALDAKGAIKHRIKPVEKPALLAANNGKLAVYSAATRKITVLDSSNPANLTVLRTIGTGGDGYGKIQATASGRRNPSP